MSISDILQTGSLDDIANWLDNQTPESRLQNIQSLNKTVSNMVQLTQVHEATILHNLQMR